MPSYLTIGTRYLQIYTGQGATDALNFHHVSLQHLTHYEIFQQSIPSGPPPKGSFAIDVRLLRDEFLQLQAKFHPDHHQGRNKAYAEKLSARINEAYKTLRHPLLRAQYLLSLYGITDAKNESTIVTDRRLLTEVLDFQDRIEAVSNPADLEKLKKSLHTKVDNSIEMLNQAFDADQIGEAREEAMELKYWINLQDRLSLQY